MHYCLETNDDSGYPMPITRCCGFEAEEDTPLTTCPRCGKQATWECADCGNSWFRR